MGPGFRFMDIRVDQVIHLGVSLVMVLIFATGIVMLTSSRTRAGRVSLLLAFGLFIMSYLVGSVFSLVSMAPDPQTIRWLSFLGIVNRLITIGGCSFLIIGLRALLQRTDLLESLQEEALDDR